MVSDPFKLKIVRYELKLYMQNSNIIYRDMIFPIEEELSDVYTYIHKSLPKLQSVEIQRSEFGICLLNFKNKDIISINSTVIDRYWIDGEGFSIEYKEHSKNKYMYMVIDCNLNKDHIFKNILPTIINHEIKHIDKLKDCWMKRKL